MKQYLVILDARSPYAGQVFTVVADSQQRAEQLAKRAVEMLPEQARPYHHVRDVLLLGDDQYDY